MSTSVLSAPPDAAVRLRPFAADEYHAMAEAGILQEDDRVELIDGHIIAISPVGDPHLLCVNRLNRLLVMRTGADIAVSVQNPVRLGPHDEPEPDVVLTTALDRGPRPEDVLLLIEVSGSTLAYDRAVKLPRYAAAGIPEVWIVNLGEEQVEVHRDPSGEIYRTRYLASPGEALTIEALPEVETVPVNAILQTPT